MDKEIYLQDRLANLNEEVEILWSTLEAIHDAMESERQTLDIYKAAVLGASNTAFAIKKMLKGIVDELDGE